MAKNRKLTPTKLVIFSLVPALALLIAAEVACRVLDLATPSVHSAELPEQRYGIMQADPDLFWSMKPTTAPVTVKLAELEDPMRIEVNSLGLRYPELPAKEAGEYRILSLGESSTFGAYISNNKTYSARLEVALDGADPTRRIRVINGGVSAWSSFQSVLYLELRGLKLQPDMVLFYHEFNDYLPSSLRSSDNTEVGLAQTDKQLHESRRGFVQRQLVARSALIRFLVYRSARSKVSAMRGRGGSAKIAANIGLPAIGANPQLEGEDIEIDHDGLPRRVSSSERRENFAELKRICDTNDIKLVIIHPAYRATRAHECILTGFCEAHQVLMFEAIDALHRDDTPVKDMFIDSAHPSALGHQYLADGLLPFVQAAMAAD
jgi:lysophospholipase L1-like esterase